MGSARQAPAVLAPCGGREDCGGLDTPPPPGTVCLLCILRLPDRRSFGQCQVLRERIKRRVVDFTWAVCRHLDESISDHLHHIGREQVFTHFKHRKRFAASPFELLSSRMAKARRMAFGAKSVKYLLAPR